MPQEGDRLGSSDAPVTIQVFADLQCSSCREDFLSRSRRWSTDYARQGDVKLLLRHYSVAENPLELGFFGAEAAAEQGYGWQYTYLFFRNQDEAERFGIDEDFMASLAGSIGELERARMGKGPRNPERRRTARSARRLQSYDELGDEPRHPRPNGDDRQRADRDPHPSGRALAGPDRTCDRGGRRQLLMRPGRRPHQDSIGRVS